MPLGSRTIHVGREEIEYPAIFFLSINLQLEGLDLLEEWISLGEEVLRRGWLMGESLGNV